jgi:hypothetical protein
MFEIFHVNLIFLAQWFLKKKIQMTQHHSCIYLPFKEDLTLYFIKLEFPSLKDQEFD